MLRYAAQNVQFARTPFINVLDENTKKGGPDSSCWLYTGRRDRQGAGIIQIDGVWSLVAREAYARIYHINIPASVQIVQVCGESMCWNPNHLFLAGDAHKELDRAVREYRPVKPSNDKRQRGEDHVKAKLTAAQVADIRAEYSAGGVFQKDLAQRYGVTQGTICRAIKGTTR